MKENGLTIIAIIIGLSLLGILLLIMHKFVNDEHWVFKLIIVFFLPLIILTIGGIAASISSGTYFENIGNGFYQITLWFMRLFYTYVILAFVFSVLMKIKTKK
jgi:hypothetical protein